MKKSFLMLGLAVAAMSSCTNDEVIDLNQSNQKAIGFESFVNKGTRAATTVSNEVTSSNLNRFYVYGNDGVSDIFEDVSVIKSGENWVMQEAKEKYWETKEYKFAAYADGVGEAEHEASGISTSFEDGVLSFDDYTISTTQAEQTDLIAATIGRDNTNNFDVSKVSLGFKHLLSKVDFKFENTNSVVNKTELSMVITDVKLNVINKADCEYDANGVISWTLNGNEVEYALAQPTYGDSEDLFSGSGVLSSTKKKFIIPAGKESAISLEYFVIPEQTAATIEFHVAYYDNDGNLVEEYNKSISLFPTVNQEVVTWTSSYIYKYNVQLPASPNKIEFTVKPIEGWQSQNVTLNGANAN